MKAFYVKPRLAYDEARERFDCPEGVREYHAEIDGADRSWKEYIPSGYDGTAPVPLVLTLHGGSSRHGAYTHNAELSNAWAMIAERETFIVVYPQALTPEHTWSAWEDFSDAERTGGLKDDIRYLDLLISLIRDKYRIDPERIYLHGQSFGDVMATFYLLNRPGHPFAAAATLSGPVGAEKLFRADGSCRFGRESRTPVVRTHGSLDMGMPFGAFQHLGDTVRTFDLQREGKARGAGMAQLAEWKYELQMLPLIETWKQVNACGPLPLLSVRGRYNAVTWPGDPDFHFYTVEKGGHGPSMDMADFIWSCFFTGWRKVDGEYVRTEAETPFVPDENAVVLAAGAGSAYVNQRPVTLRQPAREIEGVFYLAAEDVPAVFPALSMRYEDGGLSAVLTRSPGTTQAETNEKMPGVQAEVLQCSANNRTYVWNGHLRHGDRTLWDPETETLLLPAAEIAGCFMGQKQSAGHGICYLSGQAGEITYDFSRLVKILLGLERMPSGKEMYDRVTELLRDAEQPYIINRKDGTEHGTDTL